MTQITAFMIIVFDDGRRCIDGFHADGSWDLPPPPVIVVVTRRHERISPSTDRGSGFTPRVSSIFRMLLGKPMSRRRRQLMATGAAPDEGADIFGHSRPATTLPELAMRADARHLIRGETIGGSRECFSREHGRCHVDTGSRCRVTRRL